MSRISARRIRLHAGVCVSAGVILTLVFPIAPPVAYAAPPSSSVQSKKAEADEARAALASMRADLEVSIEEYNALSEAVQATEAEIVATQDRLQQAREDLLEAQTVLSKRLADIYKSGSVQALDVFLGVRSFDDFMTRVKLLRRVTAADAEIVSDVEQAQARVEATARSLEQRREEQRALLNEAEARAAAIEGEVARQERFVAQLSAEVQALIEQQEAQEREQQEARAREAAALAARAATNAGTNSQAEGSSSRSGSSSVTGEGSTASPAAPAAPAAPKGGSGGDTNEAPRPPAASRGDVVSIALGYVGVPYLWGGSTPSGFDCSGFVQYVYRQVGVSLPRTSRSQFSVGTRIPADRKDLLRPGDLVFFGTNGDPSRIHHVGIYVGGGSFVHAPHTGAFVRVDSLNARIDYVGASRP